MLKPSIDLRPRVGAGGIGAGEGHRAERHEWRRRGIVIARHRIDARLMTRVAHPCDARCACVLERRTFPAARNTGKQGKSGFGTRFGPFILGAL